MGNDYLCQAAGEKTSLASSRSLSRPKWTPLSPPELLASSGGTITTGAHKRLRTAFWLLLLGFTPMLLWAGWLSQRLFLNYRLAFILGGVWAVFYIVIGWTIALARCTRCGARNPYGVFRTRCRVCRAPIDSDGVGQIQRSSLH